MHTHQDLKIRQRAEREGYPEDTALRVHRALSWLDRAEQCDDDQDARFIFLWVAFNAAYANELDERGDFTEQTIFQRFISRLVELDDETLYELVWSEFSGSIRLLLDNRYVCAAFWDYHGGRISEAEWRQRFEDARATAHKALSRHNTKMVLVTLFSSMYVLRNQLIHGGATWNSSVNRDQVRDSANILGKIVPQVIKIMMDHPEEEWGRPSYPVVK